MLAVSQELTMLDDPAKATGDRLQIPGAESSGDWSQKVHQSDVPSHENPGQASADRMHMPGVQAAGDRSQKVPQLLQYFKEGFSGKPSGSHDVVVELSEAEQQEKTLDDMRVSSEEEATDLFISRRISPGHPNTSKPSDRHNVLTRCPKDPTCEVSELTKSARAPCRNRPENDAYLANMRFPMKRKNLVCSIVTAGKLLIHSLHACFFSAFMHCAFTVARLFSQQHRLQFTDCDRTQLYDRPCP